MKERKTRVARWAAFGLLVAALCVVAAGCGGGDDDGDGGASTAVEGLGTSLEEIQSLAREEGEVNVVQWPGYAQLTDEFTAATGCTVNTKDGASSDDMISLIQTGAYDGVSASGNASVRLMTTGEVAPVDTELIPNYADVQEGIKDQDYNSLDGQAVRCSARPRPELPHVPQRHRPRGHEQLERHLGGRRACRSTGGKISIYDDSIFIADAAVYLKATQPDLGIDNPYQLERGAVQRGGRPAEEAGRGRPQLLAGRRRQADRRVHERRQRRRHDVAVPVRAAHGGGSARGGHGDQAERGHDGLVGHVDALLEGREPELHVPLDEPHDLSGGAGSRWPRASARRPST